MTNELFETLTGFDPTMWVAINRKKTYANGQSMTYDAKRILLEGLVKRCDPLEGDIFDDQKLECVRVYRGSTSYYTFYIKDEEILVDTTSASSLQKYLDAGHSEEDAYKFASSTYNFQEKDPELDVVEGVELAWELVSIDKNNFKIVNNSKINGVDYREITGFRYMVQVAPTKLPMMNGLLVLTNGSKISPTQLNDNELSYTTRYDQEADAYICEIEDEELLMTMSVGSTREIEQISAKLIRTEDGWSMEPIETPFTHKWHKSKFIRISDFREAGII
ncbi:MAG: hypothetical protein P8J32_01190 [bacterium]|nr:hypothetical protein [bacterium]